jgi:Per os infectivity
MIIILFLIYTNKIINMQKEISPEYKEFNNLFWEPINPLPKITEQKICDPFEIKNRYSCLLSDYNSCNFCKGFNGKCSRNILFSAVKISELDLPIDNRFGLCFSLSDKKIKCDSTTGNLVVSKLSHETNTYDMLCLCKYPNLVSQKSLQDNCDRILACKPHGVLKDMNVSNYDPFLKGECKCPDDYKSVRNEIFGPYCEPRKISELIKNPHENISRFLPSNSCPIGYIQKSKLYNSTQNVPDSGPDRCIKNPCEWDVFSGKMNLNCKLQMPIGLHPAYCKCDPRMGYVPVYSEDTILNGIAKIETSPYNINPKSNEGNKSFKIPIGCFNIFDKYPKNVQFKEVCNFKDLTADNYPNCYLEFENVYPNDLNLMVYEASTKVLTSPVKLNIQFKIYWPFTSTNIHIADTMNESKHNSNLNYVVTNPDIEIELKHNSLNVINNKILWEDIISDFNYKSICMIPHESKLTEQIISIESANKKYNLVSCVNSINQILADNIVNVPGFIPIRGSRILRTSTSRMKTFDWKLNFILPYCLHGQFLHVNPYILNSKNRYGFNSSIYTNEGLGNAFRENSDANISIEIDKVYSNGPSKHANITWKYTRERGCYKYIKTGLWSGELEKPVEIDWY